MSRFTLPALVLLAGAAFVLPARADTPDTPAGRLARSHLEAVAKGDVPAITAPYNGETRLHWVGGPLNGTYAGPAALGEVWGKFAKAQAPLQAKIDDVKEGGNPAGTTVTAEVVFSGRNTLRVRYVMLFRENRLVDEIFQLDPKMDD